MYKRCLWVSWVFLIHKKANLGHHSQFSYGESPSGDQVSLEGSMACPHSSPPLFTVSLVRISVLTSRAGDVFTHTPTAALTSVPSYETQSQP